MKAPNQMRPGNRYARTSNGRTLAQRVTAKTLLAVCRRCKHRVPYPANLIPLYDENFPRRNAYKSTVTQPGRCPAKRR